MSRHTNIPTSRRPRRLMFAAALAAGVSAAALWSLIIYTTDRTRVDTALGVTFAAVFTWASITVVRRIAELTWRQRAVTIVLAALVPTLFAVGQITQLVIDDQPILTTSERAAAARQARSIETDLRYIAAFDELFSYDLAATAANLDEFTATQEACADVARRWSNVEPVDAQFGAAAAALSSAADLCQRTAAEYGKAAETGDGRVVNVAVALRQQFQSEAVRAGRLLSIAASVADVPLAATAVTE